MAGLPVKIVTGAGVGILAVTPGSGAGLPVIESAVGIPVRIMASGGLPVTGLNPSPPAGGSAFSESIKNPAILLSNSDETATLDDAGVQDVACLATVAITSGQKVRIEFQVTEISDRVALGIGTIDLLTGDSAFLGCVGGNGIGNYSSSAGVWENGNNVAGSDGFPAGSVVDIDVDTTTSTISWYVDGVLSVSVNYNQTGDVYAAIGLRYDGVTIPSVTITQPGAYIHAPAAPYTEYGA